MQFDPFGIYVPGRDASVVDMLPLDLPRIRPQQEYEEHQHSSIDAKTEIRLIELFAAREPSPEGKSNEYIRCKIQVHKLEEAPDYEALSYTWGNMMPSLPISLIQDSGDTWIGTTPQLMMALRRLRLSSGSRLLWIDQLSINQTDDVEKSFQVQLMGDIYKKAKVVVIWLGELILPHPGSGYEHPGDLLSEMMSIVKSYTPHNVTPGGPLYGLVDVAQDCFHDHNPEQRRRHLIYDILNRQWFQRAWVFQEAALARNKLLVQIGTFQCKFENLMALGSAMDDAEHAVWRRNGVATHPRGLKMLQCIDDTRKSGQNRDATRSMFLPTLLKILDRVQAFDPRDLIYAFLSFNDLGPEHEIVPNYRSTAHEVWRKAATTIIRGTQSLDIFAAVSDSVAHPMMLESWVPNWSDCFPYGNPIAMPGKSKFKAARNISHIRYESDDPARLVVHGKMIDKIGITGTVWEGCGPMPREDIQRGLWGYLTFELNMPNHQLEVRFQTIETDIMRLLVMDGAYGTEQPVRDIYGLLEASQNEQAIWQLRHGKETVAWSAAEKVLSENYDKLEKLSENTLGKQWFMSEQLYLGIVSPAARIGDSIAILHGSRTPVVLRQTNQNEYSVVGQCYLEGWMYGDPPKGGPHCRWWEDPPDRFIIV